MDKGLRAYYDAVFERDFLRKKGSAFQDFFADLMEKRYSEGDFIRIRPWGKIGDRKSDGYLRSRRILFQVYAPNEMKVDAALKKIDEDFNGALPYWKEYFDTWVFMHNARDGLSADITSKLLDLDQLHKDVSVKPWGFEELRRLLFELALEDIAALLGPAPGLRDYLSVGFEDLKCVLDYIKRQSVLPVPNLQEVPRDKAKINLLSEDTEALINAGRVKSASVGTFLMQYPDPEYGDQVTQAFKDKYDELRHRNLDADSIFRELQVFAGGERTREPKHQAAVLSVLAYLFDHCDIFESERGHAE